MHVVPAPSVRANASPPSTSARPRVTGARRIRGDTAAIVVAKLQLTHVDERVLEQLQRRRAPQAIDTIAAALSLTREVVVLSLARLQLIGLAEPMPVTDSTSSRSWAAKS